MAKIKPTENIDNHSTLSLPIVHKIFLFFWCQGNDYHAKGGSTTRKCLKHSFPCLTVCSYKMLRPQCFQRSRDSRALEQRWSRKRLLLRLPFRHPYSLITWSFFGIYSKGKLAVTSEEREISICFLQFPQQLRWPTMSKPRHNARPSGSRFGETQCWTFKDSSLCHTSFTRSSRLCSVATSFALSTDLSWSRSWITFLMPFLQRW